MDTVEESASVLIDEIQGFINIIVLNIILNNRHCIVTGLLYCRPFGCRIQDSSKDKKLEKTIHVKSYIVVTLIGANQLRYPQVLENLFEDQIGNKLWVSNAVIRSFTQLDVIHFLGSLYIQVRSQFFQDRLACSI